MDAIELNGMVVRTLIGTAAEERLSLRPLSVDLRLELDLEAAGSRDDLALTVDYAALQRRITGMARGAHFYLLEAFAEACAHVCLESPLVHAASVRVEKPGVLPEVRNVVVTIRREKRHGGNEARNGKEEK